MESPYEQNSFYSKYCKTFDKASVSNHRSPKVPTSHVVSHQKMTSIKTFLYVLKQLCRGMRKIFKIEHKNSIRKYNGFIFMVIFLIGLGIKKLFLCSMME